MPYDEGGQMWKIPVYDKQGLPKGLLKLARCEYGENGEEYLRFLQKRSWVGKPRPQHFETLLQWEHVDRYGYYLLIGFGNELTENDYARDLTPQQAADWLIAEGYALPAELPGLGSTPAPGTGSTPPAQVPLTPDQRGVWALLEGQALIAKEIAKACGGFVGEDSIRKRIAAIRKTGRRVDNRRGLGYFRPDAPPQDQTGAERESG